MINRSRANINKERNKNLVSKYIVIINDKNDKIPDKYIFYIPLSETNIICMKVPDEDIQGFYFPILFDVYHFVFTKVYLDAEINYRKEQLYKLTRDEIGIKHNKYFIHLPSQNVKPFPLDFRKYSEIISLIKSK